MELGTGQVNGRCDNCHRRLPGLVRCGSDRRSRGTTDRQGCQTRRNWNGKGMATTHSANNEPSQQILTSGYHLLKVVGRAGDELDGSLILHIKMDWSSCLGSQEVPPTGCPRTPRKWGVGGLLCLEWLPHPFLEKDKSSKLFTSEKEHPICYGEVDGKLTMGDSNVAGFGS
jgi:hypothetical protein